MIAPPTTIGVDLGGSNARAVIVTRDGGVMRVPERLTRPERDPEAVLRHSWPAFAMRLTTPHQVDDLLDDPPESRLSPR